MLRKRIVSLDAHRTERYLLLVLHVGGSKSAIIWSFFLLATNFLMKNGLSCLEYSLSVIDSASLILSAFTNTHVVTSTSWNTAGAFEAPFHVCLFFLFFFPFYLHACWLLLTVTESWCSPTDKLVLSVHGGRTEAEAGKGKRLQLFAKCRSLPERIQAGIWHLRENTWISFIKERCCLQALLVSHCHMIPQRSPQVPFPCPG